MNNVYTATTSTSRSLFTSSIRTRTISSSLSWLKHNDITKWNVPTNICKDFRTYSAKTTTSAKIQVLEHDSTIGIIGSKYSDTRQYLRFSTTSLPNDHNHNGLLQSILEDEESMKVWMKDNVVASLYANRNIIFGAKLQHKKEDSHDSTDLVESALPLLQVALTDCGVEGEQPQALSTLIGLSAWVRDCLSNDDDQSSSQVLQKLREENDTVTLEAIVAIATGEPRPGHSVLGAGTYRDGQAGWEALAKEYVNCNNNNNNNNEIALYKQAGGNILNMEYLADTSPSYLKEAGGTMTRFIFW